ncbi:MAG: PKD domain-containing protein [Candidatus Brocadiaceae bacterium]|uniref:PKD domain-containing protein n=1 Tax=Candidatus Wunengus sp. YC61 TaxID=3367698 RepID=UPI0027273FD4|nr:PKD domain-containing protein [Candidatus Brocadiaceae bacterium]
MSVRCVLKKVIQVLVYDSLVMGISSISIFFILTPQRSYSQEASKIVETSSNLQQQNTLIENHSKQHATDSIPSAISQSVRKITKKRGFRKALSLAPVIDKNGNVYLASCDGKLSAIDSTGNTKWYIQLADNINVGCTISSDDTLYFSSEKTLYAISSNGVLKWLFNADNTIDFPSVLDNHGNVYIVTKKDDFLYAIRPDGSLYWKSHIINGHISTPPSISTDGNIYITTHNNTLYAINADGTLRWRREIHRRQTDPPASAAKTASIVGFGSTLQSGAKPMYESQAQTSSQALLITHVKSEEIQASSGETDRPSSTSFTASTVAGTSPLTVRFSDNSTGKIIRRLWDFGDGTPIKSEQYPVHTYTIPGDYNVRLIIRRPDNTSTIIRQSYITVIDVSNSSKESMTNIQRENNNLPSALTSVSNIPKDTKLSDSETLVSIANSKDP